MMSHSWLLSGGLGSLLDLGMRPHSVPSHMDHSLEPLNCSNNMVPGFSQVMGSKRRQGKDDATMSFD